MGTLRKLNRQIQKNKGELPMKKVVARKLGLTNKELNKKYFNKNKEEKQYVWWYGNVWSFWL